jgi:transcriptional regulator with XRE-family HTH domain
VAVRPLTPPQHFGASVRRVRESLGYSQERLAELAGIHRNYAGAVERGERNVALVNMVRLARALGVPLSTLVDGIDDTKLGDSAKKRHRPQAGNRANARA